METKMEELNYEVDYHLKGSAIRRRTRVRITEGYSTFEDIRKIIANLHFGGSEPGDLAKIKILSAELEPPWLN